MHVARRKTYLSAERKAEIVAAYEAGATVYELAQRFGIHRDRVAKLVKSAGGIVRYHERREVDLQRAAELEAEGLTKTQIAERLGIGRTTLIVARRRARGG